MRWGCTVREVMVAMVVLTLLAAAVLPALVKMRETAARTSCQNTLRQHGNAAHNYHGTHQHFPSGTLPNPALPPEERLSFHVALVPYMEATSLDKLIAKDEAWDAPANVEALEQYQARLYQCPAWNRQPNPADHPFTGPRAFTNYVGVAGVGSDAAARPAKSPGNGMFGYDRVVKLEDVSDGLPNTIMLIETTRDVGPWIRGGPSTVRAVGVDDSQFGGTHSSRPWVVLKRVDGFNVLLADASVRFTKPDIAPQVLAALATVAGGEVVDW